MLINQLFNTMRGLDLLQPFVDDTSVTEIMVNGADAIFVERDGQIYQTSVKFDHVEHLTHVITRFLARLTV